MSRYWEYGWRPYVSVGERRRQAARKLNQMQKAGRQVSPVEVAGRKIAVTFWGGAWCLNLESYSDYANRLPRGRTYVRNGSVIDLRIEAGRVRSLVSGSDIYEVDIRIEPLAKRRWKSIQRECAGEIGSLVELLGGSISSGVMEIVTRKRDGLFPSPRQISLDCSCPDWAAMCKHAAATLYGVGARLDHVPELLFALRGVDPAEMVEAAVAQPRPTGKSPRGRMLESAELSAVFGVDVDTEGGPAEDAATDRPGRTARGPIRARKKTKTIRRRSAAARNAGPKKSSVKRKPPARRASANKKTASARKTPRTKKTATAKKSVVKQISSRAP